MRGKGFVRPGKEIALVISNEDMHDLIRIIKSLEDLGLLIDGVSKKVKHEIKKQEGGFLGMLLRTLGVSIIGNMLPGKGVMKTGKGVVRAGIRYNNMDHLDHMDNDPSFK